MDPCFFAGFLYYFTHFVAVGLLMLQPAFPILYLNLEVVNLIVLLNDCSLQHEYFRLQFINDELFALVGLVKKTNLNDKLADFLFKLVQFRLIWLRLSCQRIAWLSYFSLQKGQLLFQMLNSLVFDRDLLLEKVVLVDQVL